jgi:hypothetical protein
MMPLRIRRKGPALEKVEIPTHRNAAKNHFNTAEQFGSRLRQLAKVSCMRSHAGVEWSRYRRD